jgi:membrane protease YdiL (CAAX protease family)
LTETGPPQPPEEPEEGAATSEPLTESSEGPPLGRIFSLEGRPAPGLYLVAWVLSVGGVVLMFLGPMAFSDIGRTVLIIVGALALTMGLAFAAGYQIVARRDRQPDHYRGPAPLLVFGVVLAASSVLSGLLLGSGLMDPDEPVGFLASLSIVASAYAVAVWLFVVRSDALSWREMRWPVRGSSSTGQILRGVGFSAAVMLPLTIAILVFGGLLATLLGVEAPDVLPTPGSSIEALAIALAAAVVAPIGEELFFRGFALTAWRRDLGIRAAIVRSSVFFAVVHIVNITSTSFAEGAGQALLQTAVILPLGVVLGWLFVRHGMIGSITGHITYNSFLLFLLLLSTTVTQTA